MNDDSTNRKRYYDLMRKRRTLIKVLDAQFEDGVVEVKKSEANLAHEVEKLINLETDPQIYAAISRAAWETQGESEFTEQARIFEARVALKVLTNEHGPAASFRKSLREEEEAITKKEDRRKEVDKLVRKLEDQLAPVFEHNSSRANLQLDGNTRERIESAGWLSRAWNDDRRFNKAHAVYTEYGKKNGYNRGDRFISASCFDDMKKLAELKAEAEQLGPEIEHAFDKYYQRNAAYGEIRNGQKVLEAYGADPNETIDFMAFRQAFCDRLGDDKFITQFAANTVSGEGGAVVLSALAKNIKEKVQADLGNYREKVNEMTELWEGPIGILAADNGANRPLDRIEDDMQCQALMGGYIAESAATTFRAISSFRPEHTEGPVSLTKDLHMHMVENENVDPAYIFEVCGMKSSLARKFNVDTARPQPNFEAVLSRPNSVERIIKEFAQYMKDNAADETLKAAGFAAGQFNTESIEVFLQRYFSATTTQEQLIDILEQEAARVETEYLRRQLESGEDGPQIPDVGKLSADDEEASGGKKSRRSPRSMSGGPG